jgi:hypothetical protein
MAHLQRQLDESEKEKSPVSSAKRLDFSAAKLGEPERARSILLEGVSTFRASPSRRESFPWVSRDPPPPGFVADLPSSRTSLY